MSSALHVKEWRRRTKQRIVDAFGGKCTICSYDKCNEAFDLHHLNPLEKDFSFGKIRANPKNWSEITNELRKCILLCCRCHREVHAGITKIPDNYIKFNEDFSDYKSLSLKDKTKSVLNNCPVCNIEKPVWRQTCSKQCGSKLVGRYDWDRYDLKRLYIDENKSISSIARIVGCSIMSVSKRLKVLGIYKSKIQKIIWPDNQILAKMVKDISLEKIRKQIGCSHTGLRKYLKKNNITWEKVGVWQKRYANKI